MTMLIKVCWICSVTLYICLSVGIQAQTTGLGYEVWDELERFIEDGLVVEKFQRYLEVLTVTEEAIGAETASLLASGVGNTLRPLATTLQELRTSLETAYTRISPSTQPGPNCRDITGTSTHLLGDNVNKNTWCLTGDVLSNNETKNYLSQSSLIVDWISNYEQQKGIKYIKFADNNGVLYNYPAKPRMDATALYDARFSQWYAETATPQPKDIIIMIDMSSSMRLNLPIAQQAAKSVLATLNLNDRIGIITFAQTTNTLGHDPKYSSCYSNQLAKATDVNKDNLKYFIDSISAKTSGTSYITAIERAFQMFMDTTGDLYDIRKRQKLILLFTDGDTVENATEICNTIRDENRRFNNTVRIITFGVGKDVKKVDLLKQMANQSCIVAADIPRSNYASITTVDNLWQAMSTYYGYFTGGSSNEVKFSVPYEDIFNSGSQISMCLPVRPESVLQGVFCLDIALEYLLDDVTYFKDDDGAYAFILDKQARVLSHPLLPNTAQIAADYFFVYLPTVEIADDIDYIIEGMTSGTSGSKNTTTLRITPQGSGGGQNVLVRREATKYYWHHVEGSPFSVCIVTTKSRKALITWNGQLPEIWFNTDQRLPKNEQKICQYFTRITAKDNASVLLPPRCLDDPYSFIYFDKPLQEEIGHFLGDANVENRFVKNSVRETLAACFTELEVLWRKSLYFDVIVWRYFATLNGIFVIYPGVELPKLFDPTVRSWFSGALVDRNKYYITTPYVDAGGSGVVLSLAKPMNLVTGGVTDTVGVMSMDFTIMSFYLSITTKVQECTDFECFVINDKGFVIVHKDWINTNSQSVGQSDIHIVKEEPNIAQRLIENGILVPKSCVDISKSFMESVYWQIELPQNMDLTIDDRFTISAIPNTNLYLFVKMGLYSTISSCDDCSAKDGICPGAVCHCPCVRETNAYKYCTASLNTTESPPCFPELAKLDVGTLFEDEKMRLESLDLPACRDYNCPARTTDGEEGCMRVFTCGWCKYNADMEELAQPYCTTTDRCVNGVESPEVPPPKGLKSWEVALIVIFVLGGVIIMVVIIFVLIRKFCNPTEAKFASDNLPDYNGSTDTTCNSRELPSTPRVREINVYLPETGKPPPPVTNINKAYQPENDQQKHSDNRYTNLSDMWSYTSIKDKVRDTTVSYDQIPIDIVDKTGKKREKISDLYLHPGQIHNDNVDGKHQQFSKAKENPDEKSARSRNTYLDFVHEEEENNISSNKVDRDLGHGEEAETNIANTYLDFNLAHDGGDLERNPEAVKQTTLKTNDNILISMPTVHQNYDSGSDSD